MQSRACRAEHADRNDEAAAKTEAPGLGLSRGRPLNSPPPKSAQEPLYVEIAAGGMARTGSTVGRSGRPGRNRTCNPRIRNPMLYPLELRALAKTGF